MANAFINVGAPKFSLQSTALTAHLGVPFSIIGDDGSQMNSFVDVALSPSFLSGWKATAQQSIVAVATNLGYTPMVIVWADLSTTSL